MKGNPVIRVARIGWGTFRIGVKVHWKGVYNEKTSEFHHDLEFIPESENIVTSFLTLKE